MEYTKNKVFSIRTLLIVAVVLPLLAFSVRAIESTGNPGASGLGGILGSIQAESVTFNADPDDLPLVRVSNYSETSDCFTCWGSAVTAEAGEIVSFGIWYHNNSTTQGAQNTRVSLSVPNGEGNSFTADGSISASNAAAVSGSARVNLGIYTKNTFGPQKLTPTGEVFWYNGYDNVVNGNASPLPSGQSGLEILSGGLNLGTVQPDSDQPQFAFENVGMVVIRFKVSEGSQSGNPPTVNLDANPSTINQGQSSTLSWSSNNAQSCTASGGWSGSKNTSGSQTVSPAQTTTYTITCSNSFGSDSDSATVTVNQNGPSAPSVNLNANPSIIDPGQSTTLSWTSTNATSCTASGAWSGSKGLSGSEARILSQTTTFSITCSGPGGDAVDSEVVTVRTQGGNAPTVTINANPSSIEQGETSTLNWTSSNAQSCTASGGWSGSKNTSGSQTVSPNSDTTYRITCTNQFGSDTDSTIVFVSSESGDAPRVTITADDTSLDEGDSTTVRWDVENDADFCDASNTEGDNDFEGDADEDGGSKTVSPEETNTYRVTCSNEFGSDTDTVTVHVDEDNDNDDDDDERPEVTIRVSPSTINRGESAVLTWSSSDADTCRASGDWSGSKPRSGSQTVFPTSDSEYRIECENDEGEDDDSAFLRVRDVVNPGPQLLSASCVATPAVAKIGQYVSFAAGSVGGSAPYTFTWSGAVSGVGPTQSRSFGSLGLQSATVSVRDAVGRTASANCSTTIVSGGTVAPKPTYPAKPPVKDTAFPRRTTIVKIIEEGEISDNQRIIIDQGKCGCPDDEDYGTDQNPVVVSGTNGGNGGNGFTLAQAFSLGNGFVSFFGGLLFVLLNLLLLAGIISIMRRALGRNGVPPHYHNQLAYYPPYYGHYPPPPPPQQPQTLA